MKNLNKNFEQGVHDHDVLVDLVHISEGGKMQISPNLEVCGATEVDIRNQRPRLRTNRLILVGKAVEFSSAQTNNLNNIHSTWQ